MHLKILPIIFLLLCLSASPVLAQITLSPDGGHSNQKQITEALKDGDVYLEAGVYEVDDTIIIGSDRVLSGDPDAIILVWAGSSQWFTGSKGIISCKGPVKNVEIYGFQINGNCVKLKSWMANTPGHDKDCERCIILHGDSDDFANNIKIHDMKLYDSFSDGMYIYYAENVEVYNNFISNCQHEGIFWSCVKNGLLKNNDIAGITSDCMRLDNCQRCKVDGGIQFSYSGAHNNGAFMHGENGIQIGDAGSSHGYDARNKPISTYNIEVCNVTFANCGREAIILGSNADGNVYLHDNKFVGEKELETMGLPVDISETNPPTVEMSEKIFSSIFDLFEMEVYTQVGANDTVILPDGMEESNEKAVGTITYQTIGNNTTTIIHIPKKSLHGVSEVRYDIAGELATRTMLIGEPTNEGIVFTETSIWEGNFSHNGDALRINGYVDPENINVECITPKDSFRPTFEISTVEFTPMKLHPAAVLLILAFLITGLFIRFSLRHML